MYGLGGATKTDELSEKFQTAFDPPPPHLVGKSCCKFFSSNFMLKKPCLNVQNLGIFGLKMTPPPLGHFSEYSSDLAHPPFPYPCRKVRQI